MVAEAPGGGVPVVSPQRLDDPGVMLGREAHPAGVAQIGPHVAAGNLPESGDHSEQTAVGAALKQGAVPLFVEVDASIRVAADSGELAVDLAELGQTVGRDLARELQGEPLELRKNGAGLPHLRRVEGRNAEPPSHVGFQGAFPGQPDQGLANGSAANPKLACHLSVSHAGPRGELSPGDAVEELAVDLFAERRPWDNRGLTEVS